MRAGDWVTVRHFSDIAESLGQDSCLGGVQFLPEMAGYTGRSFRIRRFANKLCGQTDEGAAIYGMDDAVILDVARCGGESHGGCQMGCELLWHKSWLTPGKVAVIDGMPLSSDPVVKLGLAKLESSCFCSTDGSEGKRYRCQSTSIRPHLRPLPPIRLSQYYVDVFRNPRGFSRFLRFLRSLVLRKSGLLRQICGDQTRTPSEDLGVQIGERVQVKSVAAIQQTLDRRGCNRGLWFDTPAMAPYCGKTMLVSRRIVRMIDERSGELIELKQPAIVLAEAACDGLHRRFCSRGSLLFWREVWLERVPAE